MSSHPIKDLATFFDEQYQQHMAGTRYPFSGGKDAKILKDLRAIYSDDDIRTFITAFFQIEDEFIQQSGYSIGAFRGCLPKVIQFVTCGAVKKAPKSLQGVQSWISRHKARE